MRKGFALVLVAGGAVWKRSLSQAMADSRSGHESCNNACFRRTGDAATLCFSSCKNEKRACLRTGVFRTTGGIYPSLDRY